MNKIIIEKKDIEKKDIQSIIIEKKDLENLGRKLMKEIYEYFNDGKNIIIFVNKDDDDEIKIEKDKLKKILLNFTLMI